MKANALHLAIVGVVAGLVLVGCGDKHEKVHAVDKVEEAQAAAVAKAPKADAVKFDDHGQAPMGGVGENGGSVAASAPQATQNAEALETAHHGEASASSAQAASASEAASAPQPASSSEAKK